MKPLNLNKSSEKTIYLIFWILVFALPVLLSTGGNKIDWIRVLHEWIKFLPFFLMFVLNNFIFYSFLGNKKYMQYFVFTGLAITIFSFLGTFDQQMWELLQIPQPQEPPIRYDAMRMLNVFFYNFMVSILGIGLNNAIKITVNTLQERRKFEELQKENLQNQLSLLQHQISPHFFMNTLNNIYALIDYNKEIARNSVVKLSKLMRVLLYENENYTLQKEIDFINDYIELMKIRVNENVEIKFEYPKKIPQISFPPLLLISFVENSFKHGIMANGRSFIHIYFTIENESLHMKIQNSRKLRTNDIKEEEKIGLNNSRKRLDLIYDKSYKFEVRESDSTYEVNVSIPIHEDKVPGH